MKIALFQPYVSDLNSTPPLGLLYLAAVLEREGFEAAVFDEKIDSAAYGNAIAFSPDLLAISAVTAAYPRGLEVARNGKSNMPGLKVVMGGPHPSALPEAVATEACVDYVIIGEGERTILAICHALREGADPKGIAAVRGVAYRGKDGRIVVSGEYEFLNDDELDRLPYPAFHLMGLERYFNSMQVHGLYQRGKRILPIMTSRGCPFTCTYCCRVMGSEVRKRSVENVIAEVRFMIDNYAIDELYIEDDNFLFDKARAINILRGIRSTGIRYLKLANGASVNMIDDDILNELKASGAYSVSFGIESGSKSTLARMKKNIDLKRSRDIIASARRLGLLVGSNCIIGYPGETVADIRESLDYFFSLKLDSMAIINLIPFPGTEVRRICEEGGYLTKEAADWSNYYFSINDPIPLIETPQLSGSELISEIKRAYRKMYLNIPWILKAVKDLSPKSIMLGARIFFKTGKRGVR